MPERLKDFSDEELVCMAQSGNDEAYEVLIHRYNGSLKQKAHIYYIAGADSEDVIQEGMIGLYKAIRSYDRSKDASFKTYAEICISRQILSAIKMAARLKHEPLNSSISLNMPIDGEDSVTLGDSISDSNGGTPEEELTISDFESLLRGEGEKIFSKMEQQVLTSYMEGKSYRLICEEMGKSYKAIDNAMQRIRKKINEYITG